MGGPDTTFASRSVHEHVARGIVGIGLLVAAFALVPLRGPLTLLLAVPAVVLLRGCPTCWALGLVQTRAVVRAQDCVPCGGRR
jgi:hypothetical protein